MSRIGKTTDQSSRRCYQLHVGNDNVVTVKGKKGELKQAY